VLQEELSQAQLLLEQCCPWPHAAPFPQTQMPPRQASVFRGSQETQPSPCVPHAVESVAPLWLQVVPLQQPDAHETPSQTQAPFTQRCPSPQRPPSPHWQPPVEQLSLRDGSQAAHAAPALPHVADLGGVLQVAPEQQPWGQLVAVQELHTPPLQTPPSPHGVHWFPGVPQAVESLAPDGWHTLPAQQPAWHELRVQVHAPLTHCCPAPQAGPWPQRHSPQAQLSASDVEHFRHATPQQPNGPSPPSQPPLLASRPGPASGGWPASTPASPVPE
jgi:hypothetical protein